MNIRAMLLAGAIAAVTGAVWAKLPPPTEEQKAKAEDAKAKAADAAKKEGELLAKSQDKVADRYIKAQKTKGVAVKPAPATKK